MYRTTQTDKSLHRCTNTLIWPNQLLYNIAELSYAERASLILSAPILSSYLHPMVFSGQGQRGFIAAKKNKNVSRKTSITTEVIYRLTFSRPKLQMKICLSSTRFPERFQPRGQADSQPSWSFRTGRTGTKDHRKGCFALRTAGCIARETRGGYSVFVFSCSSAVEALGRDGRICRFTFARD